VVGKKLYRVLGGIDPALKADWDPGARKLLRDALTLGIGAK